MLNAIVLDDTFNTFAPLGPNSSQILQSSEIL